MVGWEFLRINWRNEFTFSMYSPGSLVACFVTLLWDTLKRRRKPLNHPEENTNTRPHPGYRFSNNCFAIFRNQPRETRTPSPLRFMKSSNRSFSISGQSEIHCRAVCRLPPADPTILSWFLYQRAILFGGIRKYFEASCIVGARSWLSSPLSGTMLRFSFSLLSRGIL